MLYTHIYLASVGYSFWQCYDSTVPIVRTNTDDPTDDELLLELKELAAAYEEAYAACEYSKRTDYRSIEQEMLDKIKQARTWQEAHI